MHADDFPGEKNGETALVGRQIGRGVGQDAVELERPALDGDQGEALMALAAGLERDDQVVGRLFSPWRQSNHAVFHAVACRAPIITLARPKSV